MKISTLEVLSEKEIGLIHDSSLELLEQVGLRVESERVLNILKDNGCIVDFDSQNVRFSRDVIERCLETVPSLVKLLDRDGNVAVVLGDGSRYCASGHNAVFTMVDETGERREATSRDVEEFAIVSDYLEEVDVIGIPYSPQDVNAKTSLLYAIKGVLDNSRKPIFYSSEREVINKAAIEMAKTVLGKDNLSDGSNLISQLSTTSPLYWERGAVEALYVCAKEGIPINFLPQPIAGVTAPYTLAGILTLHNTEVLSGIVIAQLINPGTPLVYGAAWTTYEMKQSNVLLGRAETSALRIAGGQMAHYYNMPSHTTSPESDSNLYDEQTAWEKMLSTVASIIGANDMIVNMGMFGTGMTISLEQLVMDSEICKIVRRFMKGIEVNEETIALDTIKRVGVGGLYLMEDNTIDNLRSGEHVELSVSNGANYEMWKRKGAISASEKAHEIVKEMITKGSKSPLDKEASMILSEIINKYESQIV